MQRFKIVKASNFDNENYDEEFVTGIPLFLRSKDAQEIADTINAVVQRTKGTHHPDYYKVVGDTYILHEREA